MHYVYVLRCGDDTLYTGYTTDVERRLAEHRAGEGAKYTRGRGPLEPVHVEAFDSRSAAMRREAEIKALSRAGKERLVAGESGLSVADVAGAGPDDGTGGDGSDDRDRDAGG